VGRRRRTEDRLQSRRIAADRAEDLDPQDLAGTELPAGRQRDGQPGALLDADHEWTGLVLAAGQRHRPGGLRRDLELGHAGADHPAGGLQPDVGDARRLPDVLDLAWAL